MLRELRVETDLWLQHCKRRSGLIQVKSVKLALESPLALHADVIPKKDG